MKNQNETLKILTKEWVLKAQEDERSAEILIKEGGSPNTICFLAQQIAEKYLKAFLVFNNQEFPKIHDLERLLKFCEKIERSFNKLQEEARFLSSFYIATRYPGEFPNFDLKTAKEAFEKAKKIKSFVLKRIKL